MKKAEKRHPAASLPAKPPKRTGKRGIGPKAEPHESAAEEATPKKPRQARLPEMQDPKIEELEAVAEEYAEVRDRRMALTEEEVSCKDAVLAMMHKHDKKKYVHAGIEIRVVATDETVKVRIKKDE